MRIKINKKVKVIFFSILGIAFLLFATLIVHIVVMVKKNGAHNMGIELGRVDFKQNIDSTQAADIQVRIKSIKGVRSTYFNYKDNILIYAFDNSQNNSQAIYNLAIKDLGIASAKYTVAAADMNKGCPAMRSNSFYGKLTSLVYKIVN